jgi:hypothetical protein
MKRRFREQFKLSPKQYERCWQQILREGVKSGEFRPDLDVQVVSYRTIDAHRRALPGHDPLQRGFNLLSSREGSAEHSRCLGRRSTVK